MRRLNKFLALSLALVLVLGLAACGDSFESAMVRAAKEMQDGTFDPNQMDDFLKAVSPMLNPQQRERMASLIAMVKAQAKC